MKHIKVSVGIILDRNKRFFVAKRPYKSHQGGRWEFPGGKVEQGETACEALSRELREEVGLQDMQAVFWKEKTYQYSEKAVNLSFFWVLSDPASVYGAEAQETRWIDLEGLMRLEMPEANLALLPELQQAVLKLDLDVFL